VAITSQIPPAPGEDEVRLADAELAACGLPKQSIVKLGKIFTIHKGLIRKRLGHLPSRTLEEILRKLLESLQ
jgi:mRNA-degrading endonuclease toxin of MazEF toxin-antitoxin module